jgi:tRNA pseudouridine(38-40) synthase
VRVRSVGGDTPPAHEHDYIQLLNRQLPDDIRVLSWRPVPEGFSARFRRVREACWRSLRCHSRRMHRNAHSARWRQYKYYFYDDGTLDLAAMRDAAARFVVRGLWKRVMFCTLHPRTC